MLRGEHPPAPPFLLALPLAAFVTFASISFLWTWDERAGGIALAFFIFPFVAGLADRLPLAAHGVAPASARSSRSSRSAPCSPRSASGRRTRERCSSRRPRGRERVHDVLPRHLAVQGPEPVRPLPRGSDRRAPRRDRSGDGIASPNLGRATGVVAFLFAGLFFSYSQSSFVALFVGDVRGRVRRRDRRFRIVLLACALAATLAAGGVRGDGHRGTLCAATSRAGARGSSRSRSRRSSSDRSRAWASAASRARARRSIGRARRSRNASHTTPLTMLAELGVVGFALYVWLLAAVVLGARPRRPDGSGVRRRSRCRASRARRALAALRRVLRGSADVGRHRARRRRARDARRTPSDAASRQSDDRAGGSGAAGTLTAAGDAGRSLMPKAFAWILAAVTVARARAVRARDRHRARRRQDRPSGALDTDLEGVTVSTETTTEPPSPSRPPEPVGDRRCWRDVRRRSAALARAPDATLGLPARKFTWTRGLGSYIEFPPVYCDGELYVNTLLGHDVRDRRRDREDRWTRRVGGTLPSSPAIDGPRVLVASQDGTVTALDRVDGSAALAGADGRQGRVVAGRRRRDSRTSARTTAGSSRCGRDIGTRALGVPDRRAHQREPVRLRRPRVRHDVRRLVRLPRPRGRARSIWTTYLKRDAFRYESFYASPSTRRRAALLASRARARSSRSTPRAGDIVVDGRASAGSATRRPRSPTARVFAGGFDGRLRAFRATSGRRALEHGGRTAASSARPSSSVRTCSSRRSRSTTYALAVEDGTIAWRLPLGKYTPGIATERTYFFSLNGRLIAVPRPRRDDELESRVAGFESYSTGGETTSTAARAARPPTVT